MSYDEFRRSRYIVDHSAVTKQEGQRFELVICPACEQKLFATDAESVPDHIASHDPADFGLSPLQPAAEHARGQEAGV